VHGVNANLLLGKNGSPSATNVVVGVVVVVVVVVSQLSHPIVMKLFTHINNNILHKATVAEC